MRMRSVVLRLALLAAACAPMMVIRTAQFGPLHWMEGVTLLTSQETWLRHKAGEAGAWLLPTRNGAIRVKKPPLIVWLNMLAWSDLDPAEHGPHDLARRARLVSTALTILMMLGIFWIGCTLMDARLGLYAAAILLSMHVVQMHARMSTYDVHLVAWSVLSVAGALWAMRPFVEAPGRVQAAVGWGFSGLMLGAGLMTKGPIALLLVGVPVSSTLLLDRQRSVQRGIGFLTALTVALAVPAWWYVLLARQAPHAPESLWREYWFIKKMTEPVYWYALHLLWLALPWTVWLIAGLFHPFRREKGVERRRRLVSWVWFVLMLVIFSIPPTKALRYLIMLAPPAALVAAFVWRDLSARTVAHTADPKAVRVVVVLHWVMMAGFAVLFGGFLAGQDVWVEHNWLSSRINEPVSWPLGVGLTLVLVPLVGTGIWWHRRGAIGHAFAVTVLASAAAGLVYWSSATRQAMEMRKTEQAAAQVLERIGDEPLAWLRSQPRPHSSYEFLWYLRRVVPRWTLERAAASEHPPHLLTASPPPDEAELVEHGWTRRTVLSLEDEHVVELWSP